MSQAAAPQPFVTACPHCRSRMRAPPAALGRQVHCPSCAKPFVVTPAEAAAPAQAQPAAQSPSSSSQAQPAVQNPSTSAAAAKQLCAICQGPMAGGESTVFCPDCKSVYHEECWEYNQGCAVYGCPQVPSTQGLTDLEVPASFWGQEEKACPRCGRMILAAAVRCRHCGATFASAAPQGRYAYHAHQDVQARLPAVRTATLWLLVLGILPCTAPLAAVGGPIWYVQNRDAVRALPPLNGAMAKIAIGVACCQTALAVLFTLLYAAFK